MFTGIIQNLGKLELIVKRGNGARLKFSFLKKERNVQKGESISVNGACLTAARIDTSGFEADLLPETLSATNLGSLQRGDLVNLERSLRAGDSIGGHFVTGHVDSIGKIKEIRRRGMNWSLLVHAPKTIISKLPVKSSVTCDGVSLTVQSVVAGGFSVAVIPHTLAATTLGRKKVGDKINLEIDMLMRYLECIVQKKASGLVSKKMLQKQGF